MKALFISDKDVKVFTTANGNIDPDKIIQYIEIAQDIHVLNYLGQDLYTKLQDDVLDSSISGNYLLLLEEYVKPMLIHWAMVEYLPFAAYTIGNKGMYKHGAENSETVDKLEIDSLQSQEMRTAQGYTRRMIDYICKNIEDFPEYKTNEAYEVKPSTNASNFGWFFR